jgi:hypothetical protein
MAEQKKPAVDFGPLNDNKLIIWLKNNYKSIEFINKQLDVEVHARTAQLHKAIINLSSRKTLSLQRKEVIEVWRCLLGNAIIFLKSRDNREKIHDDEDYGVETLNEFFETFRDFEPLLYGAAQARYRDHIMHMLAVFLTGEYLIHNYLDFDQIEIGDEELSKKQKVSAEEKEAMWCIISLTHDLGIPLERITDINNKAREMLTKYEIFNMEDISYPLVCLPVDDLGIRLISSSLLRKNKSNKNPKFVTHVQSKYYMKFSEGYAKRSHGILGCLLLTRNLVYFLESDFTLDMHKPLNEQEAKQFLIRRNILRAIASHDNDNIYNQRVPDFSFLLLLIDEIHEWGRPRFISMIDQKGLNPSVTIKGLTKDSAHYVVTFKPEDNNKLEEQRKKQLDLEIIQYFLKKADKFRRKLRSAVNEKRKILFTFEVENLLGESPITYIMVHIDPQHMELSEQGQIFLLQQLEKKAKDMELNINKMELSLSKNKKRK